MIAASPTAKSAIRMPLWSRRPAMPDKPFHTADSAGKTDGDGDDKQPSDEVYSVFHLRLGKRCSVSTKDGQRRWRGTCSGCASGVVGFIHSVARSDHLIGRMLLRVSLVLSEIDTPKAHPLGCEKSGDLLASLHLIPRRRCRRRATQHGLSSYSDRRVITPVSRFPVAGLISRTMKNTSLPSFTPLTTSALVMTKTMSLSPGGVAVPVPSALTV